MRKKISIVTPTFNEEQNVEKLCKLISEELNKTNYDYEHIVIDNCSTDNTVKILKKISNENKKSQNNSEYKKFWAHQITYARHFSSNRRCCDFNDVRLSGPFRFNFQIYW